MGTYRRDTEIAPSVAPAIDLALRDLEKQVTELSEMAAALEVRLASVMKEPEPVQVRAEKNGQLAPSQSPMASSLRRIVQESASIAYRLSSIITRLEI